MTKCLAQKIEEIINTYIVCPDRGVLSDTYRKEAITQILMIIKAEAKKGAR